VKKIKRKGKEERRKHLQRDIEVADINVSTTANVYDYQKGAATKQRDLTF